MRSFCRSTPARRHPSAHRRRSSRRRRRLIPSRSLRAAAIPEAARSRRNKISAFSAKSEAIRALTCSISSFVFTTLFLPVANQRGCRSPLCPGSRRQPPRETQERIDATASLFRAAPGAEGVQDSALRRRKPSWQRRSAAPSRRRGFEFTDGEQPGVLRRSRGQRTDTETPAKRQKLTSAKPTESLRPRRDSSTQIAPDGKPRLPRPTDGYPLVVAALRMCLTDRD